MCCIESRDFQGYMISLILPYTVRAFFIYELHLFIAGGTFALYSLLCRLMNIGITSRKHSNPNPRTQSALEKFIERSILTRRVLLFIAMLGMCMLIGDGILTPAISGMFVRSFSELVFRTFFHSILFLFSQLFFLSFVGHGRSSRTVPFCQ